MLRVVPFEHRRAAREASSNEPAGFDRDASGRSPEKSTCTTSEHHAAMACQADRAERGLQLFSTTAFDEHQLIIAPEHTQIIPRRCSRAAMPSRTSTRCGAERLPPLLPRRDRLVRLEAHEATAHAGPLAELHTDSGRRPFGR